MELNVESLLDNVSGHVKSLARTETILGDEFTLGEYTCRPVIRIGTGFGGGTGSGDDPKAKKAGTGGGAGAGIGVSPVGFLVTRGEEISFIASDKKSGLSSLMEKVPDLVEKMAEMKKDKDGKDKEKPASAKAKE